MDRDDDDDDVDPAPAAPARFQQQQRDWSAWSIDAIELLLQAFLRYLGAFVDFLDRIISYFEAPREGERRAGREQQQRQQQQQQGSSVWMRVLQWLGSGVRNLPQDRSSLWMPSVAMLLVCFVFLGFRTGFRLFRIVEVVQEQVEPEKTPSKRLLLPDGRYIAYRELGVSVEKSKHSGLVVRGLTAFRETGIPGLNDSLLEQFQVCLITYDLPGFGLSDPNPNRTFNSSAQDMELIANALRLGERFWLLVHPGGGPYAWAAIRYIPERLSGVVMLAPVGNPSKAGDVSEIEEDGTDSEELSSGWRFLARVLGIGRFFPIRKELKKKITKIHKGLYTTVADKEQVLFEQREFINFWEQNLRYTAPDAVPRAAAAPKPPAAERRSHPDFSKFFKIRLKFPSVPVRPAFRLVKSFIMWWWPRQTKKEPTDDAAVAPDAAASFGTPLPPNLLSETWEAFKLKLGLVVVLLVISLLVLR
ncbi:uncharacterized protein LOC112345173 [Selaginella moellendorffii]|uniref:uncharacterized protein LOC112345173 n=1 Tax=Selaginella moellendorffii TaxID=88036 RepID=UPI000D1CEFA4|nr:uncharacterized protein LOC112345173 [Selaginella moellendorffii]|eukprot:XP_024527188.1 uncharacterized protein LOC112345173 [Selaginella moellendorffii]